MEGDFVSNGNVVIEGTVHGNVAATGHLTVGESAVIDADVRAASLQAAGVIKGNVHIEDKTELSASSTLEGDLSTRVLHVDAGATINGRITMGAATAPVAEEEELEA